MDQSSAMRNKMYDAYLEFFEVAERKRRWNIFDDVPWDQVSPDTNSEQRAIRIETYCAEEMYLPDYNIAGVEMARGVFGLAWFQTAWSMEESRHGLVLKEYLLRSGLRSAEQIDKLSDDQMRRIAHDLDPYFKEHPSPQPQRAE